MTAPSSSVLGRVPLLLVLGATALLVAAVIIVMGKESGPRSNVVLITIDTVRADHLGSYGHSTPTSPRLDELAAGGVRYANALSQAPWTLPSMASLHTALYPSQHGAFGMRTAIADQVTTVAEKLQQAGYRTSAVVTHKFVSSRYGFEQGFDEFDEQHVLGHKAISSGLVTSTALEQLGEGPGEPFFLWVHYFDPHFSYVRHEDFGFASSYEGDLRPPITVKDLTERPSYSQSDVDFVLGVYDEEIAYTDREIGRLIDGLEERGLGESTAVIVTADHGEAFFERGKFGHGGDLYRELTHVPLVIGGAIPEVLQGQVIKAPVEVLSIAPTILGLAGMDTDFFQGVDLLAPDLDPERWNFSEGSYARGDGKIKVAVVSNGWKLILDLQNEREELYHVPTDPGETRDRLAEDTDEVRAILPGLRAALAEFQQTSIARGKTLELDGAEIDHLRSLGYTE